MTRFVRHTVPEANAREPSPASSARDSPRSTEAVGAAWGIPPTPGAHLA